MATTRGCSGKVKVASTATGTATAIGELRDWSFEETSEQIDTSAMGDCTKKFTAGAKATTGQLTVWWDGSDTAQDYLIVGNTVYIDIYPEGDSSTDIYYAGPTGGAVITSVSREGGGVDGVVGSTFGFTINGTFSEATVT